MRETETDITVLRQQLAAALARERATSEVLRTINKSTFDLQAVLGTIVERAMSLGAADGGYIYRYVDADHGYNAVQRGMGGPGPDVSQPRPVESIREFRGYSLAYRVRISRSVVQIEDQQTDPTFPDQLRRPGVHTMLGVPLLRDGNLLGVLGLRRQEIRLFSPEEVQVVQTFADQAAIAIENARLFNETREALAQQTALSEVLNTISRSAFDLDTVLQTIVERAASLCDADGAAIHRRVGDVAIYAASYGDIGAVPGDTIPIDDGTVVGRAMLTGKRQYIPDARLHPDLPQDGPGTRLNIPFVRDGVAIGSLAVTRRVARPFSDSELRLFEVFADQAAIAIENVRLFNETREGLERQTALGEVLRATAASPGNIQPVLDAVAANAARLLEADDVLIARLDGAGVVAAAHVGQVPVIGAGRQASLDPGMVSHRAILEARTIHVPDLLATEDFPAATDLARQTGQRTSLAVPLLREGRPVGAILIRRTEVRPFTQSQIQLLQAFADQAAIAIENVSLFNETKEALERQTAISDVLQTIGRSAFDLQPVLDAVVERAVKLCDAQSGAISTREGEVYRTTAFWGASSIPPAYVAFMRQEVHSAERGSLIGRTALEGRIVHIADVLEDPDYQETEMQRSAGYRTMLGVPLLRDGRVIGVFALTRNEVRPFTERQVELVRTFADQAAIAIENTRLFSATKEALEQQTAVGEVLKTISRSAFDLRPVLDIVLNNAVRLAGADIGWLSRVEDDKFTTMAYSSAFPEQVKEELARQRAQGHIGQWVPLGQGGGVMGFTLAEGRTIHVPDVREDEQLKRSVVARLSESRTVVGVPMIRDGRSIGGMVLARYQVRPFAQHEIDLVQTFADQAAIAIENVRLFNETKSGLDRQTAMAEVLRAIAASPTDVKPVLDAIAESAARFCGAKDVLVVLAEQNRFLLAAHSGFTDLSANEQRLNLGLDRKPGRVISGHSVTGRAYLERRTMHVPDVLALPEDEYPVAVDDARRYGDRALLATPLLRKGEPIGVITLRRTEPQAFDPQQIDLVRTFADQAVIAIENVRLFNETNEALARQTAVAQVLGEISQSGFDLKPVLETVIAHATKLCAADQGFIYRRDGELFRLAVSHGITPEFKAFTETHPLSGTDQGTLTGRVVQERKTVHVPDVLADPDYRYWEAQKRGNYRALLGVPMIRDDEVIGVMLMWRTEPRPFTDEEIALVTTFASQATIAIENVRLFDETKEALQQQSAISEVLKTISGTVFELRPTLQTVVQNAAKLADADLAWMTQRTERDAFTWGARYARTPELTRAFEESFPALDPEREPGTGQGLMSRLYVERRTIAMGDIAADPELLENSRVAKATGARSVVGVPVISEGNVVGAFVLARGEVRPFSDREVRVVETFADQAAIAIRNVRLFNEIQDKSRELEVASRHKSEFLANMSHELRTPLNAIIGFSEVLLQGIFGEVNEKQREYLADVLGSGQHLLSLINDILDLSKIEAGRMELDTSTFGVREALASGMTIVRERASRHGIELNAVIASDVGTIEADERKVKQILYNLLSNAVKFTPDGGRVDVSVRTDNGDIRVEVRDNGIGIAPADQERIFEEFRQVGRERSREGTGLGLTLTKRFVELHGGRIWLESTPGSGSTFGFTLPLRRAAAVTA